MMIASRRVSGVSGRRELRRETCLLSGCHDELLTAVILAIVQHACSYELEEQHIAAMLVPV